jgi:NACalpha-BTF3-like transcription factor
LVGNNGYASYTWYLNNQFYSTGQVVNCSGTGTYKLEVTNEAGCKASRILFVDCGPLSINDVENNYSLLNTSNSWIVSSTELIKSITIYDVSGRLIERIKSNNENSIEIKHQNLANGIYLIHVQSNNSKNKTIKALK